MMCLAWYNVWCVCCRPLPFSGTPEQEEEEGDEGTTGLGCLLGLLLVLLYFAVLFLSHDDIGAGLFLLLL